MSRKVDAMRRVARARAGVLALAATIMGLCVVASGALAQAGSEATSDTATATSTDATASGDAPSADDSTITTATSGGGTDVSGSGDGGRRSMRLIAESATPAKAFTYGDRRIRYEYTVDGTRSKDLKIQAIRRKTWQTVRVWRRDNVKPGTYHVRWNGITRKGKSASKGAYLFRVRTKRGRDIDRSRSKGDDRSVGLYPAKFPIRARHTYGDGFGAARSGHTHQGQDIFAKCGKPIVAARGGRVQYRGYQAGGAGHYVVIDGKADSHDYVYMHLQGRGPRKGTRVRTGERIAHVGQSGNASGCHLHFEMWSRPGWYEGGHAMRTVTRHLKKWDKWS